MCLFVADLVLCFLLTFLAQGGNSRNLQLNFPPEPDMSGCELLLHVCDVSGQEANKWLSLLDHTWSSQGTQLHKDA